MQQQSIYAKWCKVGNQPKFSFMTRRNWKFLEEVDGALISGLTQALRAPAAGHRKREIIWGGGWNFHSFCFQSVMFACSWFTVHCLNLLNFCGSTRLWWDSGGSQFSWQLITDSGITKTEVIQFLLTSFFIFTAEGMRKQLQISPHDKIIFQGTLTLPAGRQCCR